MKKWTEFEENFLKENYSSKGIDYCLENLNKTKSQLRAKIARLELKLNINSKYEYESFKELIKDSINLSDVCRKLGFYKSYGNRQTIKKYIELYNIDISHFYIPTPGGNKRSELKDILVVGSKYSITNLKYRLYKEGLKNRECELCGQGEEWKGKHMSLIIDHINGINNDNRLENLRIVCPNCNATLDTHCKGSNSYRDKYYKKLNLKDVKKQKNYCNCGIKINSSSVFCQKCSQLNQRKVERPELDILLKDVSELGYSGTGRKYGVSDNSIRKWIKNS
jgi:hypothetical protein